MGVLLGLILAITFPLLSLGVIRTLDFFHTGKFKFILFSLGWGVFAYALASIANLSLEYFGLADKISIILYYAPILEEIIKGLMMLIMVKRYQLTYSFDGALYGFAIGIGFAISENIGYILNNLSSATEIAAQRIISANLVHASSSAILGIALGMLYLRRTSLRWLTFVAGIFLAISQHMIFNRISLNGDPLLSAIGIGILGTLFVTLIIQHGKKQARSWIKQKLGMYERVTPGEVAAVDSLSSTDDVLLPIVERFGAEKASQVEKLLYLQARLGLKRKILLNFQADKSLQSAIEVEIRELRVEIKAVYRAIGAYAMLFVRGLYTEEVASVWDQMQAKIRDRSARSGDQKGGGLWSSLNERVKAPTDAERLE